MKHSVVIISNIFDNDDIQTLNEREIDYTNYKRADFSAADTILVVITLLQSIGSDAAYDILKHILLSITSKLRQKRSTPITENKEFHLDIAYGEKKFAINIKGVYSEEETKKIIDAAVNKLIDL